MKSSSMFLQKTVDCIFRTRRGTLYQLTDHNRKQAPISAVNLNLTEFLEKKYIFELLQEQKISFKKYLNLENYENYMTIYSRYADKKILGTSSKTSLKLFIGYIDGYQEYQIQDLIRYGLLCKPDVLVSFGEVPDILDSGHTSNKRAAAKNLKFLEHTLDAFRPFETKILAPIVATTYQSVLEQSVKAVKGLKPSGYVIQGLYQGESFEQRDKIYSKISQTLGEDEVKTANIVLSGDGEPVNMLHAMSYGVNLFETDYPFECAKKGFALQFDLENFDAESMENKVKDVVDRGVFNEGLVNKYHDLNDKRHKMVQEPLVEKCECYTCRSHTQAYIHSLLDCSELTANLLLTIHNVHTYQKFIVQLRKLKDEKMVNVFINWFMRAHCISGNSNA